MLCRSYRQVQLRTGRTKSVSPPYRINQRPQPAHSKSGPRVSTSSKGPIAAKGPDRLTGQKRLQKSEEAFKQQRDERRDPFNLHDLNFWRFCFGTATSSIIAANLITYAGQAFTNNTEHSLTLSLIQRGDMIMKHGEIWRLATSNFLHAYPVHIYSNMVSLWILGPPLECVSGKQRFCCIYAAGGLAGSITSLLLNPQNTGSMGASGAILGLIGAQLVFNIRHKSRSGPGTLYHKEMKPIADGQFTVGTCTGSMLTNLGLVAAVSLGIGSSAGGLGYNNWAHVGGLMGGAAAAWLLGPAFTKHDSCVEDSPPWPIVARQPIPVNDKESLMDPHATLLEVYSYMFGIKYESPRPAWAPNKKPWED